MKTLFLCLTVVLVLLAASAADVMADIPETADYRIVYQHDPISGNPTWSYLPNMQYYYGLPVFDWDNDWYWWRIPNQQRLGHFKAVVWEVEWMPGYSVPTDIPPFWYLGSPFGNISVSNNLYNPANNSWTTSWVISAQPDWERIFWPKYTIYAPGSYEYITYRNYYRWFYELWNVSKIEVATICYTIPEPGSLAVVICGLAGLGGAILRRRR